MIEYPDKPTYWIISTGGPPLAGVTMPGQVTTTSPQWSLLLRTVDETEWRTECERLGIGKTLGDDAAVSAI